MIYVIRDNASGLVKVGFTASADSLKGRMHDYVTHCPGPVELLRTYDGDRSIERDLHGLLYPFHHRSEWFRVTIEQVDAALATPGLGSLFLRTHEAGAVIGVDGSTIWLRAAAGKIPGACSLGGDSKKWIVTRAWAESVDRESLTFRRITAEVVPTLVAEYERGDTLTTIAKRHGWSQGAIRSAIAKAGVTIRSAVARGGGGYRKGEDHGGARLTEDAVRSIRARFDAGERYGDLSREHNVSRALIARIVKRRLWKHVA